MDLEIKSKEDLEAWLQYKPVDWVQAIAVRAALRVFPVVFTVLRLPDKRLDPIRKQGLILQSFRAIFISWAADRNLGNEMHIYAIFRSAAAIAAVNVADSAADSFGAATYVAARVAEASADARADMTEPGAFAAAAAFAAAVDAGGKVWAAISADCAWLQAGGGKSGRLIERPLWPIDVRGDPKLRANLPPWAREPLDAFADSEMARETSWKLIADWYRAILPNRPPFDRSQSRFDDSANISIATQPDAFWAVTEERSAERIMDDVAGIAGWTISLVQTETDVPFPQYATEYIIEYLLSVNRPASNQEIAGALFDRKIKIKRRSLNWILSDFCRSKRIIRVGRGLYASKDWRPENASRPEWDFFLSYSKDDVLIAKRISDTLEMVGLTVFSQFSDMTAGKSFVREMNRGLGGMGRLIAVYSPSYFLSGPCQAEWEAAYTYDASGELGKIVPFLVRPCEPTPLARRLIWTPLIGLDPEAERNAILAAVRDPSAPHDRANQRVALKQAVSPDVTADNSGRLDAAPNVVFDDPFVDVDLVDLPELLRTLIKTAVSALEGRNCPSGLVRALKTYSAELEARGVNCSFGVLRGQMDFIEAEIEDPAAEHWLTGAGLRKTLENMRKAHAKLGTHYPLDQLRERLFRAIEVDSAKVDGADFQEIEEEIAKATDSALEDDIVTDTYRSVSANRQRVSRDILELKTPLMPTEGDEAYIQREADRVRRIQDAKKRALAQQVGFADKSLDVLTKLTTVADSQSGRRLAIALSKLVDWFW